MTAGESETGRGGPDILFIMADDHAADAISAYGSRLATVAPTPNVDPLAAEAVLLSGTCRTNARYSKKRESIRHARADT